jgi:hypothetical protein
MLRLALRCLARQGRRSRWRAPLASVPLAAPSRRRTTIVPALLAVAGALAAPPCALAQVRFAVNFDDPFGTYALYYGDLSRAVGAAGARWGTYLATPAPVTVDVRIGFSPSVRTANGGSATLVLAGTVNGLASYTQGLAAHLATGVDPNGATHDVAFTVGTGYLTNTLWFDPDPDSRVAPVPAFRVDAVSVFMHEFGHALAFNGWRDGLTGRLPGSYQSTFDRWVTVDPLTGTPYYTGPRAVAAYGGFVPLTHGNLFHVGNWAPRAGADLVPDLMNGVVYDYQRRYDISALNLAIAADAGVLLTPEPGSAALVVVGLCGLCVGWAVRRRRPARHA